jgi:hypothetical protein
MTKSATFKILHLVLYSDHPRLCQKLSCASLSEKHQKTILNRYRTKSTPVLKSLAPKSAICFPTPYSLTKKWQLNAVSNLAHNILPNTLPHEKSIRLHAPCKSATTLAPQNPTFFLQILMVLKSCCTCCRFARYIQKFIINFDRYLANLQQVQQEFKNLHIAAHYQCFQRTNTVADQTMGTLGKQFTKMQNFVPFLIFSISKKIIGKRTSTGGVHNIETC